MSLRKWQKVQKLLRKQVKYLIGSNIMIKTEEYKLKIKELKGILSETGHSL